MKNSLQACLLFCLFMSNAANAENDLKKLGKALIKAATEPAAESPPTQAQTTSVPTPKVGDDKESFEKPENSQLLKYEFFVDPRQIFPSIILTALDGAKISLEKHRKSCDLGDVNGAIEVIAQGKTPNQKIKIKTYRNNLIGQDTENEYILPDPNTVYVISPTIAWDFEKLAHVVQPTNETFKFEIQVEGQPTITKILQPRVRSINDALIAIKDRKGKESYLAPITFAGYVNENSPVIDQVLKETKELAILAEIPGLNFGAIESGASLPVIQASAIWFYLQSKHYKYSSITQSSAFNENVASQSVRSVEDTYNATQANCVDGSVFIASILRKVGIDSYLVLKPGHMYLMFYNDVEKKQPVFIETTMMGANVVPGIEDLKKMKKALFFKGKVKKEYEKSYNSFAQANAHANSVYSADFPNYQKNNPNSGYALIPIGEMRKLGVNPINR